MPHRSWLFSLMLAACAIPAPEHPALSTQGEALADFVERQLREHGIPGATVALLDVDPQTGEERLWARGFGQFDAGGGAMPPDAIGRVASISKLFTATAAMALVEAGKLDLDAPIQQYLPELVMQSAPAAPAAPVTLRLLLGHRAGIVREPPVGHYFDPTAPTLAATVASLAAVELVAVPGARFKYSNPGIGVVGEVIARVTGKSFEQAIEELVLRPLALRDSSFAPRQDLLARVPHGVMWTYDGRAIPTPQWPLGFGPAANLYSSAIDLVRFARSWSPDAPRRVLSRIGQSTMWQLPAGQRQGCGLGFWVRELEGNRQVGHDGAVYGFASALQALPEAGIAVAVICCKDFANAISDAIAERALRALLASRRGESLPLPQYPQPVGRELAQRLAGSWRCGEYWVQLQARGEELYYDPDIGVRTRMRRAADGALVADDVLGIDTARRLIILPNGNPHDGEYEYVRESKVPPPAPAGLQPYLGEYGWDHNTLIVYEDHGRLAVLIEWVVRDLPEPQRQDHYVFPPGMYGGDQLQFERVDGAVVAAVVGGARFLRRPDPQAEFRVQPTGDVAALTAAARAAQPPPQPPGLRAFDLVDLATLDPGLRFDIRYASTRNFLGTKIYERPIARLQRPAAMALLAVHRELAAQGFGLLIYDAYRPWFVTKVFADATPAAMQHFVADPRQGSRHNRGCAVDLGLYDLATGEVVDMPSGFDEFTARAYPDYPGGTSRQRFHREVLRLAMERHGFAMHEQEWWHFDHADWREYGIGNEPL